MEYSHDTSPAGLRRDLARRGTTEWLVLAAMGLLGCLLGLFGVLTERRLILRDEVDRLQVQARIVDENLRRQLQSVRNALDGVRRAAQERGGATGALPFQTLKSAMPGVRAIVALDAQGNIVQSSDDLRDARLDDRAFLRSIAGMRDPRTLYMARPYENAPGQWNIKLSMALDAGTGRPGGVVTAILNTAHLDVVTQSVVYAPDMASAIAAAGRLRGGPRCRLEPMTTTRRVPRPPPAAWRCTAPIAAADLQLEKPLVVTVSRSYQEMNKPWLRLALEYGVAWCLFALVSSAGLYVMQKKRAAFAALAARRDAERTEHAQRIELTLAGANLGLWELELAHSRLRIDHHAAALVGGTTSDAGERDWHAWREQIHPADLPRVEHALAVHLNGQRASFESEHRLRRENGDWVWVLSRGRIVERDALGRPLRLLGTRMDISDRKRHEQEIERLAFYDGLTALPNRRLLLDRLERALATHDRAGQCGAVLFIDLDNFKDLNDTLGHDRRRPAAVRRVGPPAGSHPANRTPWHGWAAMNSSCCWRVWGSPARMPLSAPSMWPAASSTSCRGPTSCSSTRSTAHPASGIALFGESGTTVDELLKQADLAMYQAKSAGRNTLRLFDPQMQTMVAAGAALEADLRGAQQRGELVLHYQLILDANRCAISARSTAALEPSAARRGVAGHLHPDRREVRADPVHRQMGAGPGLRAAAALGRRSRDAAADGRGQRQRTAAAAGRFRGPGRRRVAAPRGCCPRGSSWN